MNRNLPKINEAARAVAARVVEHVPPFKVPLAESVQTGELKLMSTNAKKRHAPVVGLPPVIGEILAKNPNGLSSYTINTKLGMRGLLPSHWKVAYTSVALSAMKEKGWVTLIKGRIWKLGETPIAYHGIGRHSKKPVVPAIADKAAANRFKRTKEAARSALSIVQKYHPEVVSVTDATENKTFQVTREDSRVGDRKKPGSCALAKCAEREYDGAIISLAIAYLVKGSKAIRYRVPSRVARELVSFDRSHKFAPGEYKLLAPSSSERLGYKSASGSQDGTGNRVLPPIQRRHKTEGIRSL